MLDNSLKYFFVVFAPKWLLLYRRNKVFTITSNLVIFCPWNFLIFALTCYYTDESSVMILKSLVSVMRGFVMVIYFLKWHFCLDKKRLKIKIVLVIVWSCFSPVISQLWYVISISKTSNGSLIGVKKIEIEVEFASKVSTKFIVMVPPIYKFFGGNKNFLENKLHCHLLIYKTVNYSTGFFMEFKIVSCHTNKIYMRSN